MTVKNKSKIIIMTSDTTNSTNGSPKRVGGGNNKSPSSGRGPGVAGGAGGNAANANEDEHAIIESIDQCVACANGVDLHLLEGQARSDLNAVLRGQRRYGAQAQAPPPPPSTPSRGGTSEGRTAAPPTPEQMSLRRELEFAGANVCKPPVASGCCVTGGIGGGGNAVDGDAGGGAADASSPSTAGTATGGGGSPSPSSAPMATPPPTCRDDVDVTSDGVDGEGGDFGSMLRDYELCADRSQVCEPDSTSSGSPNGPLVVSTSDGILASRRSSSSDLSDLRVAATANANSAGAPIGSTTGPSGNFAIDRRVAAASAGARSSCAVCWEVPPGGASDAAGGTSTTTGGGKPSSPLKRTYFYAKETKPSSSHNNSQTEILVATSSRDGFANLPCCGGKGGAGAAAMTRICTGCILILCTPTSDNVSRIGRCPLCREWISVTAVAVTDDASSVGTNNTKRSEGTTAAKDAATVGQEDGSQVVIRRVDASGQCRVCNQARDRLVDSNGAVCDSCYLGMRCPLLYECSQCHAVQRIPHPMYRYQVSVDRFGEKSWACNAQCNNFSFWRIVPSQVGLIPAGDAPPDWGHDYVETAREKVMEVKRQIRESPSGGVGVQGSSGGDWCAIS